ncbi:putative gustatory receptor 92a [Drosophila simulans]|uniref:Gustatory receptor n=1 Tax=Drosophila simulans TaxID=7240 RepID=B4QZ99_DROSI|nr:putative gustatory receptor 92a [Drosophila simulans]EDX13835.1 GD18498 [Drosophila simulans]KMZ04983.1 uncharacterized protein Dsimw501_GD18498 [Drosophila simulans]
MKATKYSVGILRFMSLYARFLSLVCFRLRKQKDNDVLMEEVWSNRSRWKWISVTLRIVPLCIYAYTYADWICNRMLITEKFLHSCSLVVSIPCYLSMIYLKIYHGPEVTKLVSQYLHIFRLGTLDIRRRSQFGGGRELFLLILSFCCQIHEYVFILVIASRLSGLPHIIWWVSYTYVCIICNSIMFFGFIWNLSLGVLYAELNDNLRFESGFQAAPLRKQQRIRVQKSMTLFKEISFVVTSLQDIFNVHLFLSAFLTLLQVLVVWFKMILDLGFSDFWIWSLSLKNLIQTLLPVLAIQEAANQFEQTRERALDIFFVGKSKHWIKSVEMFITHLNLNEFRVNLLGLFNVSNELFLVIVSEMFCFLVFVTQCVILSRRLYFI